jgi:hypothetical protein
MTRVFKLASILGLLAVPGFAGSTLYHGTFAEDDDTALLSFTITSTDVVTIESYGYAGGTVPTPSTVIPEGGFAPEIFLFDSTGTNYYGSSSSGIVGGTCLTAYDSVTGNCDDPYFQDSLSAGSYTVALAVYDNALNGPYLSDGFTQDGNPGFTCQETGGTGPFCDVTYAGGPARDGDYALTVSAADLVALPEPAPAGLFCIGVCFFAALLLRRRRLNGKLHEG